MEKLFRIVFVLGSLLLMVTSPVHAVSLENQFYSHGSDILQRSSGPGASTQRIELNETARFYGSEYSSIVVNSNGFLAFGNIHQSVSSPEPFPSSGGAILAAFWAHANYSSSSTVYYHVTDARALLDKAINDISPAYERVNAPQEVNPSKLVIVTWTDMRNPTDANSANTFQSILVICPSSTYVILQYANGLMNWAGHPPALVGFNAGDGTNSFTVPTSLTSRVLELTKTGNTWNIARNTRNRGRWVFRVDRREVTMPGTIIGFSQLEYTTLESEDVEICASVFGGSPSTRTVVTTDPSDITTKNDYRALRSLTFRSANSTKCTRITIINDSIYENNETFSIRLSTSAVGVVLLPEKITITIIDDDTVFVTYGLVNALEENGTALICINLVNSVTGRSICGSDNTRTQRPVHVSYQTFSGIAEDGIDFVGKNGTITVPAGRCRLCDRLQLIDDPIFEELETLSYVVTSNDSRTQINTTHSVAYVYITDNDGPSVRIGMSQKTYTVREGEQTTVCASMTAGQISQPLVVTMKTDHNADLIHYNLATDNQDFIVLLEELTFVPEHPRETFCRNITTLRDSVYEGTEVRGVILTTPSRVTIDRDRSILEILDNNEVTVKIEKTLYNYVEGENNRYLSVCANLTGEIERNLHVDVSAQEGSATFFDVNTARNGDVDPRIRDIVFGVPEFVGLFPTGSIVCDPYCLACTNVLITNDNILEQEVENFTLHLSHQDPAVHLISTSATVFIIDNDRVNIIVENMAESLSSELREDSTIVPTICLQKRGLSAIEISVQLVPHAITATENSDFIVNSNQITFPILDFDTDRRCSQVSMTILDDLAVEANETVKFVLESEDPERVVVVTNGGAQQAKVLTIVDNDAILVSFTESNFQVDEGNGGVEVCMEMTGFTAVPLIVAISTQQDTAKVGTDFLSQSIPLQFPSTEERVLREMFEMSVIDRLNLPPPVSPPFCVNVSIINDDVLEHDKIKQFFLDLSHQGDARIGFTSPQTATVTITDDDNVTIIIDEASRNPRVTEGEAIHVCARMIGRADFVVNASFRPMPAAGSALVGVDYVGSEQEFQFPANGIVPICVEIPTLEDSIVEREEVFEVELTISQHEDMKIVLEENATLTATIVDNDFVSVGFELAEYTIIEGEGSIPVCVTMTGRLDIPAVVTFSAPDPPQGATDYVPIPSILLFQELSTESFRRECVNISIFNDSTLEDTESFEVFLNSSDNIVHFTREVSSVYIIDDDGVRLGLRERTIAVSEGMGQIIPVCVDLIGRIQRNIDVVLETRPLTADVGVDYNLISSTLTFMPAETNEQLICVNFSLIDDSIFEDNETFLVSMRVHHSAVSIHIRETTITILDDDHVTLAFTISEDTVAENVGVYDVCVQLSGPTAKVIPYQLEIRPVDVVPESDVHFNNETLFSFPISSASLSTQCHRVDIVDDEILENTEYFEGILTKGPVSMPRLTVGIDDIRVAITDNDMVTIGFTQTEVIVNEDDEQRIELCAELVGEIGKEVSVSVSSQPGTADAGDFDAVNSEIRFSPGLGHVQCFDVIIKPDRLVERNETFTIIASSRGTGILLQPRTVLVTITDQDVVCQRSELDTSRGYFIWPESYPEETAEVQCENGITTRFCSRTGDWEKPFIQDCYVSSDELFRYIEKHGFSEDNLRELLFAILQLEREQETPKTRYTEIIDQVLVQFAQLVERSSVEVDTEIFGVLMEIINALQAWPSEILVDASSSIVKSFERVAVGIFEPDQFTSFQNSLHNIAFYSNKDRPLEMFPQDKNILKYSFHRNQELDIVLRTGEQTTDYEASITLPKSIVQHISGSVEAGLLLNFYDSGIMFPRSSNNTEQVYVSSVVAASFVGQHISNLKDNVLITIKLGVETFSNVSCVSWDFEANGGHGNWIEDGCEVVLVEDKEITCACNHLTNFAVLADVSGSGVTSPSVTVVEEALSLLTIIGTIVSILGLLLTIITLLLFGKLRKRDTTKFRIQLCVAMILVLVSFVTGINQIKTFEFCVAGSAFLHYFTLVSVMWMAAEALLTFQKLVVVFSHPSTCYIITISLLCWLLPIPAVVVPVAINRDFSISEKYCFSDNNLVLLAAFLGPIALLLLFNLFISVMVTCGVLRFSVKRYKDSEKASKRKGACHSMFTIISVMLLFGVTWTFGAFTIIRDSELFEYLFVAFNSLLGFFVFLFFVVFARETQDLCLQTCGCKQKQKREVVITAITDAPIVPKTERMTLDANAERLRAMEEMDLDMRLNMNSWDIMYIMPQNQFDVLISSDSHKTDADDDLELSTAEIPPGHSESHDVSPQENPLSRSPSHSIDSAQNGMDCVSTADSGILMDKAKNTPSPTPGESSLYYPQSGSTPNHSHSVSGIGYVSDDSVSMDALPHKEEDCYIGKNEPITLAPSLRPRAVPNEYTRVHVE